MKDRIKLVRKSLSMNQQEFADNLGVSKSIVQAWESGRRSIGSSSLYMISDKFRINRAWLETGEEPMKYPEPDRDEEARVIAELSENLSDPVCGIVRDIMSVYIQLDRSEREVAKKIATEILERIKNSGSCD